MRRPVTLITGANGEIGHGLITLLYDKGKKNMIGLDIDPLDNTVRDKVEEGIQGNVLDRNLLERINTEYEISAVYHLAAILSTRAEFSPMTAHDVNVGGTINLLHLAMEQAISQGRVVKFFYPSSIATYGMGGSDTKGKAGRITEDQYRYPETMYGCNKLYCESLGIYFSRHYKRLAVESSAGMVDFRAIRFPGLISATTQPSGGTSDYGPEMIHTAARGEAYSCFVREDTIMPFMTMPDAIRAILLLMDAPRESLSRLVYHITAFSRSAGEFRDKILSYIPDAEINFVTHDKRQSVVDSWPADLDDSAARNDWEWEPTDDFDGAFEDYLMPEIRKNT